MDVVKFFKETTPDKTQTGNGYQPPGMTAHEARKCVEDVLNQAMQTVATLEKLHQQQTKQPSPLSHLSSLSKISPLLRDDKKPILQACKEATLWLGTVKSKITPTYFHLPVPDNRLTTASEASTPGSPSPRPKFIPPKLKY